MHAELSVQGIACCRNTVAKLMRRAQIVPKATRHFRVTTDSRNTKAVLPNLVRRCFKAERPNACWLSDVTYIPTREGWLYLAAVLDAYSRAILDRVVIHDRVDIQIRRHGVDVTRSEMYLENSCRRHLDSYQRGFGASIAATGDPTSRSPGGTTCASPS